MKQIVLSAAFAFAIGATTAFAGALSEVDTAGGKVMAATDSGMTVYTFAKDAENVSNCYDECAVKWPPFMAAEGAPAEGALTVIERKDDTYQWALNGKPLYFWQGDSAKGDATGDGVGGVWAVVRP
jgi:predicted lipoprotein with Yx(FWY)xxD motif